MNLTKIDSFGRNVQVFPERVFLSKIMKKIPLTQGKFAIVDDEDFDFLSQWKWSAHISKKAGQHTYYAIRATQKESDNCRMHRVIMGLHSTDKRYIDHQNHNGLDNRKKNLRICSNQLNQGNSQKIKLEGMTSKYKGVRWHKQNRKYTAQIMFNRKSIYLGSFTNEIEAAKTYDIKAKELFGEFANPNFK